MEARPLIPVLLVGPAFDLRLELRLLAIIFTGQRAAMGQHPWPSRCCSARSRAPRPLRGFLG